MNNDIQIETNKSVFNYRIAIVIKNNNNILLQKDSRSSHLTLPGGRCQIGETSIKAAIREFKEETGLNISFKKEIGMIENFFTSSFNGRKYHEILIIHELEFKDKENYAKKVIHNIEEKNKKYLTYIWLNMAELKNINFKPEIIINILKQKEFSHFINIDK